jgi:hypothetical protein
MEDRRWRGNGRRHVTNVVSWLCLHILIVVLVAPFGEVRDLELPSKFISVITQMLAVTFGSQVSFENRFFLSRGLVHFALYIVKRNDCRFVKLLAYLWFAVFVAHIIIDFDTVLDNSDYVCEVYTSQICLP